MARTTRLEPVDPKFGGFLHWGDDRLQIAEHQQALIDRLIDPDWAEVNLLRLSGGNAFDALAAASTPPFGAGGRLVIVSLAAADEAQVFLDALAADWDARSPLPGNAVLIEAPAVDRRRKGVKFLESRLTCEAFMLPKSWDAHKTLGPWIDDRLAARKSSISPEARQALIDAVGTDTFRLANEVDKLLIWVGGNGRIDLAAVRALVAATDADVFAMLACLAAGDKGGALIEAQRLLRDDPLPKLVAGMTTNLLLVKRAKELQKAGQGNQEAATWLGVHPFRLQNLLREWSRWRPEQVQTALLALGEVDRRSKSTNWSAAHLLEAWILRFPEAWHPLPAASFV